MILVDVIRSALEHLQIKQCPRCLAGELVIDVRSATIECTDGCRGLAEVIGYCANRLTGGLRGEGQTLSMFCSKVARRSLDDEYISACKIAATIPRIVRDALEAA